MKVSDFIERLCYSDRWAIQIWFYNGDFSKPIAMVQLDWDGVKAFSDRMISSIRIEESNGWILDLKILLEAI